MYGAPFYGGIVPYAYPAPAAAGVQGSDNIAKADKALGQTVAAANVSGGPGSAAPLSRVRISFWHLVPSSSHACVACISA